MTQPLRRPLQRDDLDVETTLRRAVERAPEIELGITGLRQKMRDAGWPSRTPEDDRKPSTGDPTEVNPDVVMAWLCVCGNMFETEDEAIAHLDVSGHDGCAEVTTGHGSSGIVHADPCGDLALRFTGLVDDLDDWQTSWRDVRAGLHRIEKIARRHLPVASATVTVPSCSVAMCDNPVETTASGGYRGMERVAGFWCAKPGSKPTCAKHRLALVRSAKDHGGIVA